MGVAAKSQRRPRVAICAPLTEQQLADVRRAVDKLSGSAARSVKCHGLVVYLDRNAATAQIPKSGAQPSTGTAKSRKPDEELNAKQRRARRRLEKHIAQRAAVRVPEQHSPLQAEDVGLAAMRTAMRQVAWPAAASPTSSNPPSPTPACSTSSTSKPMEETASARGLREGRHDEMYSRPNQASALIQFSSTARSAGRKGRTLAAIGEGSPHLPQDYNPNDYAYHDDHSSKGPDYPASSQAPREPPRRQPTSTRRSTS